MAILGLTNIRSLNLTMRKCVCFLRKRLSQALVCRSAPSPLIRFLSQSTQTAVDAYWKEYTVKSKRFRSAIRSKRHLQWRFEQYPLFREFMQMYGEHDNEIILDYGCGPGNDVVGFLLYTNARRVIGIDVSEKALNLASHRLGLHKIDPERVELIRSSDSIATIPLDDNAVDYIHCGGVLHHTSHHVSILREFYRVLKPGGWARVMVYNRNSVWFHLYVAYVKMIVKNAFEGLDTETAFSKTTDGEGCPIARAYRPESFTNMSDCLGFQSQFVGGYLSVLELRCLKRYRSIALEDQRLPQEHKEFLKNLTTETNGYPIYEGKHAGKGGVYTLYKA